MTTKTNAWLLQQRLKRQIEAEIRRKQEELRRKIQHELWLAKVRARNRSK